jgi:ribokinase
MITCVGSINLDFVATAKTLPAPGETVTGARLARYPGGKGANQALAAQRLGAEVHLIAATGADEMAEDATKLLREGGVDLSNVQSINGEATGVALIGVSQDGENQIIVASGANAALRPEDVTAAPIEHLIGVLEVPAATLTAAAEHASGRVIINLAPAMTVPPALITRADVLVVNEAEAAFYGDTLNETQALIAITYGAGGARLFRGGDPVAYHRPPDVEVVDTVGAGDTFTAALAVAMIEGQNEDSALKFAVAASALACTRHGAQPSLPLRAAVDALLTS